MKIVDLQLQDWRNVAYTRASTDAQFVVLSGDNAQGKTNILESIWMLATLRSFRESRVRRLVRAGSNAAALAVSVDGLSGRRRLQWARDLDAGRKLHIDNAACHDLGQWFSVLRAVLFCPEHISIVRSEPSFRRRFVDRAAFTATPSHLEAVQRYRRTLSQKAAALRMNNLDHNLVASFDDQLCELGATLALSRARLVDELAEPFDKMHRVIAGGGEVTLRMKGVGAAAHDGHEAVMEAMREGLDRVRPEELRRRRVLVGPHRDDLHITLNGRIARAYASQGQARSIVLALKLAELAAAQRRGEAPLFLLDDLTGELDRRRMARLIEELAGLPNQVWITTTDPAHLGPLPRGQTEVFHVRDGSIVATEEVAEGSTSG